MSHTTYADRQPRVARRPWLAGLMSLLLPGLGQLYNAQPNRAIWFFISFALIALPVMVLVALALPGKWFVAGLLLALAASVSIWIGAAADAYRTARRLRQIHPAAWQTSGLYALVLLVGAGLVLPAAIGYVRDHLVQAFKVVGGSMEPTMLPGEYFFVDKRYNCPECAASVERGDVAVFVYPNDRTRYYIKRVIGLPGDVVGNDGDGWRINGEALAVDGEPGVESVAGLRWAISGVDDNRSSELHIPDGHAFVLGDHRDASRDSRDFGVVPLVDIVGVARQVWFSRGEQGVRWHRLGVQLTGRH